MEWLFRQTRQLMQRSPSPPRGITSRMMFSRFITLDSTTKIEEETMPTWDLYHPVRIGEVFESKYQVLSKLGYGANSTVWFCRDLKQVGNSST
jgi:serine/threonine-protein kinase SRPK3